MSLQTRWNKLLSIAKQNQKSCSWVTVLVETTKDCPLLMRGPGPHHGFFNYMCGYEAIRCHDCISIKERFLYEIVSVEKESSVLSVVQEDRDKRLKLENVPIFLQ